MQRASEESPASLGLPPRRAPVAALTVAARGSFFSSARSPK